jgi:hypothetical protein
LKKVEEENPDSHHPGFVADESIFPQYVIAFQAEDAHLKQRVKELPQEKVLDTHHTE